MQMPRLPSLLLFLLAAATATAQQACTSPPPSNLAGSPPAADWTQCSTPFSSGATCYVGCQKGYSTPYGLLSAKCQNGAWTFLDGVCVLDCATAPPSSLTDNAKWSSCAGTKHGNTCMGSCNDGYMFQIAEKPPVALCEDGVWSLHDATSGACVVAGCQTSDLPSSDESFSWPESCRVSTVADGSTCTAQCSAGYEPGAGGPLLARRCDSGVWWIDGDRPCTGKACNTPPPSSLASNAVWTNCASRSHGGGCTASRCNTGYMGDPKSGLPSASCELGQWILDDGACVVSTCDTSKLPPMDDTFSWPESCRGSTVNHEQVCEAECKDGYEPDPDADPEIPLLARKCSDKTWWNYGDKKCVPKDCEERPPSSLTSNADWDKCLSVTDHDETCTGDCSTGYMAHPTLGLPRALCTKGSWSLQAGACMLTPCSGQPSPSLAPHTAWSCKLPVNPSHTCTATCVRSTADSRVGAPVARCNFGGHWSIVSGACIPPPGPQGCSAPPPTNLAINTAWGSCTSGAHGQQCTGTCSSGSTPDAATGRPVAMCADGVWTLLGGACLGSSGSTCTVTFTNKRRAPKAAQAPTLPEVCPGATAFEVSFPYTAVGVEGLQFTATAARSSTPGTADVNIRCSVNGAGSGTAKVSCTTANGQPLSAGTSYTVGLTANYQCNNAAASSKTTAEFRVVNPVKASLLRQGPSSLSVCQHKGSPLSVSFEQRYRLVSDQVEQQAGATLQSPSMTAISSVSGVTCTAEMKEGTARKTVVNGTLVTSGTAVVTCGGNVKPGRSFSITTNLAAAQSSTCIAAETATLKQRVSVACCSEGVSYARPPKAGATNCFQHYWPNTTSCDSDGTVIQGVYSEGPGRTVLTMYDTKAARCAGVAVVGLVTMNCDAADDRLASFTLESRNLEPTSTQFLMITCDKPPKARPGTCPGTIPWVKIDKAMNKPVISDDKAVVTFAASLPSDSLCTCKNAVWAVHESATYVGLPVRQCMN